MKIKKHITNLFVFAMCTMFALFVPLAELFAQPGLPGDPSQAPIDGGLLWLLIGGGAYGIKKIRDRNQAES